MRFTHLFAATTLLVAACAEEPVTGTIDSPLAKTKDGDVVYPDDPSTPNGTNICKTITVSGKEYYNDLRDNGRFALRRTPPLVNGFTLGGTRKPWSATAGALNKNYLGLLDGTVKLYEVDNGPLFAGCHPTSFVGETTIAADGSWSWTGQVCDACRDDSEGANDNGISIAVKVALENCSDPSTRCFSVRDPLGAPSAPTAHFADNWDGPTYERWLRAASQTSPLVIHMGTTVDLGTDYFQASATSSSGVVTDLDAQAASVFATAVDVTRKLHVEHGIPFAPTGGEEVMFYFPDVTGWSHSHQNDSNRVCINAPGVRNTTGPVRTPLEWFDGSDDAHEYGHLIHYWQWNGTGKWVSYAYDSDGDGHIDTVDDNGVDADGDGDNLDEAKEGGAREYTIAALKEGWAGFVEYWTFDGTTSPEACDQVESAVATECVGPATCSVGRHYMSDVKHVLCDLFDGANNTEANDTSTVSMHTLVDTLGEVYALHPFDALAVASATRTSPTTAPFGICDIARRLVERGTLTTSVATNALAQTLLDCGL